jgi:hypothetical protein
MELVPSYNVIMSAGVDQSSEYDWFDAEFFNGRIYTVHLHTAGNLNINSFTVSPLKNDGKLVIKTRDHIDVTNGGIYVDSVLVAWGSKLYCFWSNNTTDQIYCKCYEPDAHDKLGEKGKHRIKCDLPNYKNANNFQHAIAATLYKNRIYLVVEGAASNDNKLYLIRTCSTTPEDTLTWEFVDYIRDENDEISSAKSSGRKFDLKSIVHSDGDGVFSETLYFAHAVSNNMLRLHEYINKDNWNTYDTYIPDGGENVHLVQGVLSGCGQNENSWAMQVVFTSGNGFGTYSIPFYPREKKFGPECSLGSPSKLLACSVAIPYEDYTAFQQFMLCIGGTNSKTNSYMIMSAFKSNTIKINVCDDSNATGNINEYLFKTPELRPLIQLHTIIEGPPPSVVTDETLLNELYVANKTPSRLKISYSNEVGIENATTWEGGFGIGVGFEKEGKLGYSLNIEAGFKKCGKLKYTYLSSQELVFIPETNVNQSQATLEYMYPVLELAQFYYCSPDTNTLLDPNSITRCIYVISTSLEHVSIPLNSSPFNVAEPLDLRSWEARNSTQFKPNVARCSEQTIKMSFNFGSGGEQTQNNEQSEEITKSSEFKSKIEIEGNKTLSKLFNISGSLSGSYTLSKETTTTIKKGVEIMVSNFDATTLPENKIKSYDIYLKIISDKSDNSKIYYQELERYGLKLEEEKPSIFAYKITNVSTLHESTK